MNWKRWIVASVISGLLTATTGCSGARTLLRGQSPESEAPNDTIAKSSRFHLPRIKMTWRDRARLDRLRERLDEDGRILKDVLIVGTAAASVVTAFILGSPDPESDWFNPVAEGVALRR